MPERNGPSENASEAPQGPGIDLGQLAAALAALGCPAGKADEMASQLDKRAQQLARLKQTTYQAAMAHLLELMKQGWAAKERGL